MKKLTSLLLALGILATLALPAAAASDSQTVEQTVKALGIMVGDESGNMDLYRPVTRAEFTKMLITASSYKDTIQTGSGSSPFKDVKYTHWAADYIKTAVDAKWVTGYVDGSFRPDNTITFEESASAILKLLGYGTEDLSGTYPSAQISKFRSLKLDSGLSLSEGKALTRNDCMYIFFNLMGATNKSGAVYGTTLGYTMNAAGEIDYSALVMSDLEGPYVVGSGGLEAILPFSPSQATVYRNSKLSDPGTVTQYDVVYYHPQVKTVWAYSSQIVGTYTAASPNLVSPDSVTVAGNSYSISTGAAKHKLSSVGEFTLGDTVALLLGMDGDVVDVISATKVDGAYYGVITEVNLSTYSTDASSSKADYTLSVACSDGVVRACVVSDDSYTSGNVVSVSYTTGAVTVKRLSSNSNKLSGAVDAKGAKLGSYTFSGDVEILDVSKEGDWKTIFPSRLAGKDLTTSHIYYYDLNAQGEIKHLILNDVTGDLYSYGILTDVKETDEGGTYQYVIDGTSATLSSASKKYNVKQGPAIFYYKDGQLGSMKNLTSVSLTSLSSITATGGGKSYAVSDQVQVYLRSDNSYSLTALSAVNTSDYSLTGYYETLYPAGGQIRVIVAVKS